MDSAPTPLPTNVSAQTPVGTRGADAIADFKHGINLGNALDAPSEGAWGVVLSEKQFQMVADAGFDHVRLPVRFSAHADTAAPYTIDETFFQRVDWALEQAHNRGLGVLLDIHHYEEFFADPDGQVERWAALWTQIATRYLDRGAWLKYELLNEPQGTLNGSWNRLYPQGLAALRAVDPERAVVLDSTSWAGARELSALTIPDDPNLVATFHMYEPSLFTMQGATYMSSEYWTSGVVFPGPPCTPITPEPGAQNTAWTSGWFRSYNTLPAETNVGGRKAVDDIFTAVDNFVRNTGRAVYMGEFAVINVADAGSRERWVRLVRQSAEQRGYGWAYWDDGGMNTAYDVDTGEWKPEVLSALLED